ncbi:hypothetical protein ACFPRL_07020 [Pseudoclavibacter helvolus]
MWSTSGLLVGSNGNHHHAKTPRVQFHDELGRLFDVACRDLRRVLFGQQNGGAEAPPFQLLQSASFQQRLDRRWSTE